MARRKLPLPPSPSLCTIPDLAGRILYDQDGLLVVDKPAGIPSTGRSLRDPDSLQYQLMALLQRHLWAVHQLDADTSGVNVFTRRKSLVRPTDLRMRFPNGRKSYVAICHGVVEFDERRLEAPVGPVLREGRRSQVVTPAGRPAATRFLCLARGPRHSLLLATLESGRTHQVRVHLAHMGHPLVGEEWYRQPPCRAHPRQALHALHLRFQDGLEPAGFQAPLAPDLCQLARRLGLGGWRQALGQRSSG